ncbi:MAG: hypothetical protein JO225_15840 [Candidatus Eremiobacteraeota bacterium]|nr:hypothetical protein [Candidatus Eremiobacteraeota bacterium]
MDLLFYAIAIYTGYRTALKPPAARTASVTAAAPAAPQPVAPQAAEPQPATSDTTT